MAGKPFARAWIATEAGQGISCKPASAPSSALRFRATTASPFAAYAFVMDARIAAR